MTGQTEQLIQKLAERATPVRKLPRPYLRAAAWIALSIAYIVLVVLMMPARHDLSSKLHDLLFVVEQFGGLATGVVAALAAFTTVVPGYDRKWAILPLLPLAIWLGSLGPGCIQELNQ